MEQWMALSLEVSQYEDGMYSSTALYAELDCNILANMQGFSCSV